MPTKKKKKYGPFKVASAVRSVTDRIMDVGQKMDDNMRAAGTYLKAQHSISQSKAGVRKIRRERAGNVGFKPHPGPKQKFYK